MKRLILTSPTFLSGRFVMIRPEEESGRDFSPGEEIALVGGGGQPVAYAKLVDFWLGDLALVPGSLMEMEQNPLHRTYSGTVMGLRALLILLGKKAESLEPNSKVLALVLDFSRNTLLDGV